MNAIRRFLLDARTTYTARLMLFSATAISLLATVADIFGAQWPKGRDHWVDFALLCFIVWFLSIKLNEMWWPIRILNRLGVSLIIANAGFWILYTTVLLLDLWPHLMTPTETKTFLRLVVFCSLFWCVVELMLRERPLEEPYAKRTFVMTLIAVAAFLVFCVRFKLIPLPDVASYDHRLHGWLHGRFDRWLSS